MAELSLYLDTRGVNPGDPAPLKYRVYVDRDNVRYFRCKYKITPEDYELSYGSKTPRGKYKDIKSEITAIEKRGNDVLEKLGDGFTFEGFKRLIYKKQFSSTDVIDYFNNHIEEIAEDRPGDAGIFQTTINSLLKFYPAKRLPFQTITPEFLNKYEKWFLSVKEGQKQRSLTTVGIYLRPLRRIFNLAIKAGDISQAIYPFNDYKIPKGKKIKKALEPSELKSIYEAKLTGPAEKARDFWFFTYLCNGMNMKDILNLKYGDLTDTSFSFRREKTKRTIKNKDMAPIVVPLTPPIKYVIEKYGTGDKSGYVFPGFKKGMSEKEKRYATQNFLAFVNKHMKVLFESLGIKTKPTTMTARHSFTTQATRAAGLEFAQEALGHTTLTTTQDYWAGFEHKVKKQVADKLMDFGD